ncbi:MAG: hypothetical protein GY811_04115 [Myxococcales bacterium]|nr:hypothetical protein [Myxococcales bacterium]
MYDSPRGTSRRYSSWWFREPTAAYVLRLRTGAVFELSATDTPQLHGILALTKAGTSAFAAGMKHETPTLLNAVDWLGVLKAAPLSPGMGELSFDKAAQLYREAGYASYLHAAGVNAISFGRVLAGESEEKTGEATTAIRTSGPDTSEVRLIIRGQHLVAELVGVESRFRDGHHPPASAAHLGESEKCYREIRLGLRSVLAWYNDLARPEGRAVLADAPSKLEPSLACAEA